MAKATTASVRKKNTKTTHPSSDLHPPYFTMITEAITTLKDRTGSSQPGIAKFIEHKYNKVLPSNFKKLLSVQLKKFVQSERLVKVKNSYKLSPIEKLNLGMPIRKPHKAKGGPAAKKASTTKKMAAKKVSERSVKTKRLSQVKTPEDLKKGVKGGKMKRLSQVKTPDGSKKKKNSTPKSKKNFRAAGSWSRSQKKAN